MICHYHKEVIYAAKKLNIKIIEYQHGLIAKSDIFYNFPNEILDIKMTAYSQMKSELWRILEKYFT